MTTDVSLPVHREVVHVMGMPVSLALRGRHAGTAQGLAAWADACAILRRADAAFSTYRSDSWISRLARGEVGVADCPSQVREVLELGERARVESYGAFDVRRPGPVLDPSGVVKGWAVERAVVPLLALADTDVCLSAGGDMVCRVADPAHPDWRIGIEDPHDWTRVVAVVPVRDGAVATSGSARRGAHVVDPRTGRPPRGLASVTVVGPSLTWADIDATAALAMGEEGPAWLRTRKGQTGVLVDTAGHVTTWHAWT